MRGLVIGFGLAATLLISSPAFASADWRTVGNGAYDIVDNVPAPKAPLPGTSDPNIIDGTLHGDTTVMTPDQIGDIHLRRDQVVHDADPALGSPAPIIPPSKKVLKALVDSKTVVTGSFIQRKDPTAKSNVVASTKTSYLYLMEGGGHIWLDSKVQDVRDLRNFVIQHPKAARYQAFASRWYERTRWATTPIAIIVNALIIR